MALVGTLTVHNTTAKILKIYQGPKHRNYRGWVGPKSFAGFAVRDPRGNTYFKATPDDGVGKSYTVTIPPPPKTSYTWRIR